MKLSPAITKQPAERVSWTVNYEDKVDEGDFLTNVEAGFPLVEPVTDPPLIVGYLPIAASSNLVRMWATGGVSGTTYKATLRVRTNQIIPASMTPPNGEILEDEMIVKVKEV
jgi:hypothetical protein